MSPLIPDGIYKIHSGQFPGYVADLIDGVPGGPISAYKDSHLHTHDKVRSVLCRGLYSHVQ